MKLRNIRIAAIAALTVTTAFLSVLVTLRKQLHGAIIGVPRTQWMQATHMPHSIFWKEQPLDVTVSLTAR